MRAGRFRCGWVVALLVAVAALFPGTAAMADGYRYEAEFSEVGLLAITAFGQIEASLDLGEEECRKLVTDMVYGELRAKFPSLVILNDQEAALTTLFWRVQEETPVSASSDEVVTEDRVKLQELLHQAAWVKVSFDVFKVDGGGYYGGVELTVERPVQVWPSPPSLRDGGSSKSFRAGVCRPGAVAASGFQAYVRPEKGNFTSPL